MGMIAALDRPAGVAELDEMAKKKASGDAAPKGQKTLFAVKGDEDWYEWLKQYADHVGVSAMVAIDLALKGQAKRDGFADPMPKRVKRGKPKDAAE